MKSKVFIAVVVLMIVGITTLSSFSVKDLQDRGRGKGANFSPEEVMKKLDTDENGEISFEEAKEAENGRIYDRFGKFDKNEDGVITIDELTPPTPEQVLNELDADQNGTIELEEAKASEKQRFYKRFGALDLNSDGSLSLEEIAVQMERRGKVHKKN